MFKKLKNCQKMTELASLSYDQPLTLSQKLSLKLHLIMCPECKRFHENNQLLKQMIKQHKQQS